MNVFVLAGSSQYMIPVVSSTPLPTPSFDVIVNVVVELISYLFGKTRIE